MFQQIQKRGTDRGNLPVRCSSLLEEVFSISPSIPASHPPPVGSNATNGARKNIPTVLRKFGRQEIAFAVSTFDFESSFVQASDRLRTAQTMIQNAFDGRMTEHCPMQRESYRILPQALLECLWIPMQPQLNDSGDDSKGNKELQHTTKCERVHRDRL